MPLEILLVQSVDHLGYAGEVVAVKPGYFRNYLNPQHLAVRATEENIQKYQSQIFLVDTNSEKREIALRAIVSEIGGRKLLFVRRSTNEKQIHGSISKQDVCKELRKFGADINPRDVIFRKKIHGIGEYTVSVKLLNQESLDFKIAIISSLSDVNFEEVRSLIVANDDGVLKSVKDLINEAIHPVDNRLKSMEDRLNEFEKNTTTNFEIVRSDIKGNRDKLDTLMKHFGI